MVLTKYWNFSSKVKHLLLDFILQFKVYCTSYCALCYTIVKQRIITTTMILSSQNDSFFINPFHATYLLLPPENIRKPEVFWCVLGLLKETRGMKWINDSPLFKVAAFNVAFYLMLHYLILHCLMPHCLMLSYFKILLFDFSIFLCYTICCCTISKLCSNIVLFDVALFSLFWYCTFWWCTISCTILMFYYFLLH